MRLDINHAAALRHAQALPTSALVVLRWHGARVRVRSTTCAVQRMLNIVLAWNTWRMHATVARLRDSGVRIDDDWLRRMGPAHFGHINFRGTMRFGIDKHAHSLLQDAGEGSNKTRAG